MSLAVAVIILHSIIAHDHKMGMSAEDHISAHSCVVSVFDNYVLGFHIANGEGHLEQFVASDIAVDHSKVLIALVDLVSQDCGESVTAFASTPSIQYSIPDYEYPTLRGPPQA